MALTSRFGDCDAWCAATRHPDMILAHDRSGIGSASEVLAWSRMVFGPALRKAVDSLPASMRHIAGYHLGWWDSEGEPTDEPSGKMLRPALVLLSAEAVGGKADDAVAAAVAIELIHNFSLLHDDVMDGDETRRHRPTAWRVFGLGNAILAGDALLTLALSTLADAGGSGAMERMRALCATNLSLVDGQHADLAFETRIDVGLSECVRMAQNKTGALLSCACALGALSGGGSHEQVEHLSEFGAHLGLAFQVADDLRGIWGDPTVTGKPAHSDLRNRKKSLPVVAALASGTPAGAELALWFERGLAATADELEAATTLVDEAGGKQWSLAQLDVSYEAAIRHLSFAGPTAPAADLRALLDLVVTTCIP